MTTTKTQNWIVGILSTTTLLTVAVYLFEMHTETTHEQFKGKQIKTQPLPVDVMIMHLKLDTDLLTLDPLNFAADVGIKLSKIRIDQLRSADEQSKQRVLPTPNAILMSYTSEVSQ